MYWIWRNLIRKTASLFIGNTELFHKIEKESDNQLLEKLTKKYDKNLSIIKDYEDKYLKNV
jgi:hypothetical protein